MQKQSVLFIVGTVFLCITLALSITALVLNLQMPPKIDEQHEQNITVTTFYGRVRGHRHTTVFDYKPYYAFQGIPYAKPPLDSLRFKPPQRPDQWSHVHDFNEIDKYSIMCVQNYYIGVEDCLYINVYTPNINTNGTLPVVIAIHAGTFLTGSALDYGPDFLLNEADVVVVTFNYRLGALGFLSLDTPEFSGNMGLKDQLLAIKWTNENIYNFGGDKNKITLHGISAGSVSAHMHMLSPASKGLFQRAILVSGTANLPWAIQQNSQVPVLQQFATNSGRPNLTTSELANFLQKVDPHSLAIHTNGFFYIPGLDRLKNAMLYGPVIEHPDAIEPFMQESPMKIIESQEFTNNIDVMFGVANTESLFYIFEEVYRPEYLRPLNQSKEVQLPLYEMNKNLNYSSEEYKTISDEIMNYYFGESKSIDEFSLFWYKIMWSDIMFGYGIDRSVRRYANASSARTYYYRLRAETNLNLFPNEYGTTNQDELSYTFGSNPNKFGIYNREDFGELEKYMISTMSSMYTNFISFGYPILPTTPYYLEPVRGDDPAFVSIGNYYSTVLNYSLANSPFWENMFAKYNMF